MANMKADAQVRETELVQSRLHAEQEQQSMLAAIRIEKQEADDDAERKGAEIQAQIEAFMAEHMAKRRDAARISADAAAAVEAEMAEKLQRLAIQDPEMVAEATAVLDQQRQMQSQLERLTRKADADATALRQATAEIAREQGKAQRALALPPYWRNQQANASMGRFDSRSRIQPIQAAMRASATSGSLSQCRVHKVERVENMMLWKNYMRQKEALQDQFKVHSPTVLNLPGNLLGSHDRIIDQSTNEFWLWHGTSAATAAILAKQGFDERVASLGGLYGAGSYFADASSKSHQYAQGNQQDQCCMLYCRVIMGSAFMATKNMSQTRRPPSNPAFGGAAGGRGAQGRGVAGTPHNSIMAASGVGNGGQQGHNEFIVFESRQVYPEFIVWYTAR